MTIIERTRLCEILREGPMPCYYCGYTVPIRYICVSCERITCVACHVTQGHRNDGTPEGPGTICPSILEKGKLATPIRPPVEWWKLGGVVRVDVVRGVYSVG